MSRLDVSKFLSKLNPDEEILFKETILMGKCFYCKIEKCDYPHKIVLPIQTYNEMPRTVIFPLCEKCDTDMNIIKKCEDGFIALHASTLIYINEEDMN